MIGEKKVKEVYMWQGAKERAGLERNRERRQSISVKEGEERWKGYMEREGRKIGDIYIYVCMRKREREK